MKIAMRKRVWWPGMATEVEKFVAECPSCQLTARPEYPVPMRATQLPDEPWMKLAVDFNGPHAAWRNQSILVLVDYYSRFVLAKFVRSTAMEHVAAVLVPIFEMLGNPKSIRSCNGPPFNGGEWSEFCEKRNIGTEFSTPGHPQQNGVVERYMKMINKIITIAVANNSNCEELLKEAVDAHNMATQRTTNLAPEVLLFGRTRRMKIPLVGRTVVEIDSEKLKLRDQAEKQKTQERENRKRHAREACISEGDEVLLKRQQKSKDQTNFSPTRYKVTKEMRGDCEIEASDGRRFKRNITSLKKLKGNGVIERNAAENTSLAVQDRPKRSRQRVERYTVE